MSDALPLVEELVQSGPVGGVRATCRLPYVVFLDSGHDRCASAALFLTADPVALVRSKGALTQQMTAVTDGWMPVDTDPLTAVRQLLAPFAMAPVPDLPPFQGGAAGYLGYDWGAMLERVPPPTYDDLSIPDVLLGIYDWVIAWDHAPSARGSFRRGCGTGLGRQRARAGARLAFVKERLTARRLDGWAVSEAGSALSHPYPPNRLTAPSHPVPDVAGLHSTSRAKDT